MIGVDCIPASNLINFYKNGVLTRTATGVTFPASWYLIMGGVGSGGSAILNTGHSAFVGSGSQAWDV